MIDLRDMFKIFHVWYLLIMAVGVDPFRDDQPMTSMMLGDHVKNWSPALRAFFTGLARNGLSTHPDEIPLAGFLAFLRFYTILRRDAWGFDYLPDDGGTSVMEPLAVRVRALGGQIMLGKRVSSIGGGEKRVVYCGDESFRADQVILAVEAASAESIIKKSFDAGDAYFPRSLANAIIRMWFDVKPNPGPEGGIFTGNFVMHNFFWLERLYKPYQEWSSASGGSVLEVHIYGPQDVLQQADAALLARVISETYMAYPELRGHLSFQHLQRNEAVHTLPSLGLKEKHPGVETEWENVYCAGDWVRDPLPSFFIERACATGIKAANAVLRKRGLDEFELAKYLEPEPFAGWIESLMMKGIRKRRVS
jgi:isorenieratene synthase